MIQATPVPTVGAGATASGSKAASSTVSRDEASQKIDSAIATISRYRTAGDGGQALKLLLTFAQNVSEFPDEVK